MSIFSKNIKLIYSIYFTVGVVGFMSPLRDFFIKLTFLNVMVTSFFLFYPEFKKNYSSKITILISTFLIGFFAEIIGVNFGLLFGDYSYGNLFGPLIFGVPLGIGINWVILSLGSWYTSKFLTKNSFLRILIASIQMVCFDLLLEPVAIQFNYWKWENNSIPLYNYLSWFIISIIIMSIYNKVKFDSPRMSGLIFLSQFILFLLINLSL